MGVSGFEGVRAHLDPSNLIRVYQLAVHLVPELRVVK